MLFSVLALTVLVGGLIMMIVAIPVYYWVYKGSKSTFAFTLLAFTFLDGASNFSQFFIFVYPKTIHRQSDTKCS